MLDSRSLCTALTGLWLAAGVSAQAQVHANGYIDPTFTTPCLTSAADLATLALLVLPDGKILAGGNYNVGNACRNAIVRLQVNGATDSTFPQPLAFGDYVTSIATQSTGKIIISGRLSDINSIFPVARLNVNGTMDVTFPHLSTPGLVGNAVAVQPDNKIIVGGIAGVNSGFLVRLNADGTVDSSFAQGITDPGQSQLGVSAVALQNGKILVGGSFSFYDDGDIGPERSGLARLNADGSLDTTFVARLTNAVARALLVQPDGKILVAGQFVTHEGLVRPITRLNSDGTRDTTFTHVGINIAGLSLALEPDGRILLGHTVGIMRLNPDGTRDQTFGPLNADGFFGTDATFASALARTADGNLLVGASRVRVGTTTRRGVTRLFGNLPPAPGITQQPVSQNVDAGTNVSFSVIATGAPPISFQWRKNNGTITGATNFSLTLSNVRSPDTANYTVVVSNPGGSVTSTVARLTVTFLTSPLTIQINGSGRVSPNLNGRSLEIGRSFTLTAKPGRGFLFTNWTGFETSSHPVLTFVMQTNELLQANFVPSPFIPVRGAYCGLFYDPAAPAHETAGLLNLTLDDKGGFKGTVRMGAKTRRFKGAFSLERVAVVNIPATATLPLISMSLAIDLENQIITGLVAVGTNNPSSLEAFRKVFSSRHNPAPQSGLFNTVLPGSDDPVVSPAGDGYVPLNVSTSGRVSGKGYLADGTPWSVVSATSPQAYVPVYVSLYRGAGSIFGWLLVTNTGANDANGILWWAKPTGSGGIPIHGTPATTNTVFNTLGSRFTPVARGVPVLNLNPGLAVLTSPADSITNLFTLGGDNKITGSDGLNLSISTSKGSVTGSFIDPSSNRKRPVRGIALQNQNEARGFFLSDPSRPPISLFSKGQLFVGSAE